MNNVTYEDTNNPVNPNWPHLNSTQELMGDDDILEIVDESKVFSTESSLTQFEKSNVKSITRFYKCTKCSFLSKRQSSMLKHVNNLHPRKNIDTTDVYNDKSHQRISPSNEKSVPVTSCRRRAKNPLSAMKKFPCPNNCGSSYKNIRSLRGHCKFECGQGPRFKCPYCEVRSKYSRNILSHVRFLHPHKETYSIDVVTKKTFGNIKNQRPRKK